MQIHADKRAAILKFIPEKPLTENVPFLGASQPGKYLMFVFLYLISWSQARFIRQVYARL